MTKVSAVIPALLLLAVHVNAAVEESAVEDYLCSIGPDGEEECETVYFKPDVYDAPPNDEDDVEHWRSGLAVDGCTDRDPNCKTLSASGECDKNPGFMKYECAVSCGTCAEFDAAYEALREGTGDGPCTDKYVECMGWAAMGECGFNPNFMLVECERSCMGCFEDT